MARQRRPEWDSDDKQAERLSPDSIAKVSSFFYYSNTVMGVNNNNNNNNSLQGVPLSYKPRSICLDLGT